MNYNPDSSTYVIDAGPLFALMDNEIGAANIAKILRDNPGTCYVHAYNLTELYYVYLRRGGVTMAEAALQKLKQIGIITRYDIDEGFWKQVATFKANHPMSLPDAFCLTLACRIGGTLVTTDHNEFDPLVQHGYCPIRFIR